MHAGKKSMYCYHYPVSCGQQLNISQGASTSNDSDIVPVHEFYRSSPSNNLLTVTLFQIVTLH